MVESVDEVSVGDGNCCVWYVIQNGTFLSLIGEKWFDNGMMLEI